MHNNKIIFSVIVIPNEWIIVDVGGFKRSQKEIGTSQIELNWPIGYELLTDNKEETKIETRCWMQFEKYQRRIELLLLLEWKRCVQTWTVGMKYRKPVI